MLIEVDFKDIKLYEVYVNWRNLDLSLLQSAKIKKEAPFRRIKQKSIDLFDS